MVKAAHKIILGDYLVISKPLKLLFPQPARRSCIKKTRKRHAVREMRVDPSKPPCTGTAPPFPGHKDLGINLSSLSNPNYSVFSMSISDYFGVSWYALSRIPRTQYNLQHGWTWVKGRHTLAF